MRVLYVVEATTAGVRRHVYTLARDVDRRRFAISVACPLQREQSFGDNGFVDDLDAIDIPILPVRMNRSVRPHIDAAALIRLARIIRDGQFDVVHAHSSKAGFLARVAARLAGNVPTIYTPHGLLFLGIRPGPGRWFFEELERFAGRLSTRVIAVSQSERDVMLRSRIAPPDRIVLIENGVDLTMPINPAKRAHLRSDLGQPGPAPLIGTVARLSSVKNPMLFLDAAAQVLRVMPEARFVWCGSGPLESDARQHAAALGISHACRFLGHREEARKLMTALDLFWLPSTYEGLPYVLMEAMAEGVPVIGSNVMGNRDVVVHNETGLLVPPQDAATLAQASITLLRDQQRLRLFGKHGRARVETYFSSEQMVRRTMELYTDVAGMQPMPIDHPSVVG